MEFRILGPLEVVAGGRSMHLGGPRTQATLAALLLAGGQVVSVERLVDLVWGEDPPASVRGQVAIAISKLRRILRDGGADPDLIETVGFGYRVRAVQLDAGEAGERIAAAKRAAEEGRPAEAAAGFRRALDLWRGPVLAGLGEVTAAADSWEQLRLAVHEDWAELELALGRHGDVIGGLASFVAEHPLRERSRAQLMLALYRCGRRADALEVYRGGRDLLARELGIDPGIELRDLERAILADDPVLDVGRAQPAPATRPVPAELPPATAGFTGRASELKILGNVLSGAVDGSVPIAAITGPGGMGKSALAVRAARELADAFPDGQLHVNLHGSTPGIASLRPIETLGRFLRSLGMSPADVPGDVEEAASRYRSLTSGRRILVVLDNAVDAAQVRPLLPSGSGCAVIVTSRQVLATLDGATHVYLAPLDEREAVAMLAAAVGGERVAMEAAAALEVVRRCGGLPLAVRIVAARLATQPEALLADLIAPLSDSRSRLDTLELADLGMRASFGVSLEELPPDAAHLFAALGLLDAHAFTPAIAAAMVGWDLLPTEAAFDRLVDAQLLDGLEPGRFGMHDLLRAYARELAEELDPAHRAAAVHRAAECYLATIMKATTLLEAGGLSVLDGYSPEHEGIDLSDREEAIGWLDKENDNLLTSILQFLRDPAEYETGARMAKCMARPLITRARRRELMAIMSAFLHAAVEARDRENQAHAHNTLAIAHQESGQPVHGAEHFRESARLWGELGHPLRQALALGNLGTPYRWLGRLEEAIACTQEAIVILRELGNTLGEAAFLNNQAGIYRTMGDWEESIRVGQGALAIGRELDSPRRISAALGNIAETHRRRGGAAQAISCFKEALEHAREAGDRSGEAEYRWGLAQTHHALGDAPTARRLWKEALDILQELGDITGPEARALLAQPVPATPDVIERER